MVRCNDQGSLSNPFAGRCSLLSVEPIEKRPFFHYKPGSKYLAVGFYGCSFNCDFCQNFKVSQTINGDRLYKTPQDLLDIAELKNAAGVAFTFNEPTVYYEYIMEVGDLGADVILKTNGFVNSHVLDDLATVVSAWNVDIKGDDIEYRRTCKGEISPVLAAIEKLTAKQTHLEISYLVLPRMVSDTKFHVRIRDWLVSLNPDIPVHILYFYPFHRMLEPCYPPEALIPIIDLFKEKMPYIYVSNAFHSQLVGYRNTNCISCNRPLIERVQGVRVVANECCGKKIESFQV
jgi:pyruvate formate lyase activating enzyme